LFLIFQKAFGDYMQSETCSNVNQLCILSTGWFVWVFSMVVRAT